jgi:putative phage-type endonuclease
MHPRVAELLAQKYDDQRSPEWFALRGQMLTASDVAAAIGTNFFKHPETLILEKCGAGRKFTGNSDTARGTRLEPYVRDMYDAQTGSKSHEIGLLVHPVHKWLGGSPDGVTEDGVLIEIKCPKKISKKVPDYYMPQIQLLLEIMNLEECDFIQYCEEKNIMHIIHVLRDREWFREKLPIMDAFWKRVLYKREHGICELLTWTPPQPLLSKEDLCESDSLRDAHELLSDS